MNTSKTKTAIIFMLIVANLFFIISTTRINDKKSKIPAKMIEDTINILSSRSIIVNKDVIVKEIPSYKILEGEIPKRKTDSSEMEIYSDIIKNISNSTVIGQEILMPDATMYITDDYNFNFFNYSNNSPNNLFGISITRKDYENTTAVIDIDYLDKKIEDMLTYQHSFSASEKRKFEKSINKFLRGYKYTNEDYVIIAAKKDKEEEKTYLVLNQTYNNLLIENNHVYIEIYKNNVVYFGGKWHFGEFDYAYNIDIMDSVNILLNISSKNNLYFEDDELIKMSMIYLTVPQEMEQFYMIPMWELIFKSGKTYIFNPINGEEFIKTPKNDF